MTTWFVAAAVEDVNWEPELHFCPKISSLKREENDCVVKRCVFWCLTDSWLSIVNRVYCFPTANNKRLENHWKAVSLRDSHVIQRIVTTCCYIDSLSVFRVTLQSWFPSPSFSLYEFAGFCDSFSLYSFLFILFTTYHFFLLSSNSLSIDRTEWEGKKRKDILYHITCSPFVLAFSANEMMAHNRQKKAQWIFSTSKIHPAHILLLDLSSSSLLPSSEFLSSGCTQVRDEDLLPSYFLFLLLPLLKDLENKKTNC